MKTAIFIMIGCVLCICTGAFAEDFSVVRDPAPYVQTVQTDQTIDGERDVYFGKLRVYLTEPTSRWRDSQNHNYEFGFLKFMEVTDLALDDGESYYNALETIYSATSANNVAVIGVLFGADGYTANAYPGHTGYNFTAYPTDNAAMARTTTSGGPGVGIPPTAEHYTHPVFIEEGTATW